MTKKSKKNGAKEWYIEVADSEQRYSWFHDVKGRFEFHKLEDDKPDDKSGKLSDVSINKVPMYLKSLNRDAYLPRVVSLGLFHRRISQPLSEIELYKVDAVNRSVKRLPQAQRHARFLVEGVQKLLPEIKASYEGEIECEEELLAWLFTLDGCFILETLRLLSDESQWDNNGDSQWNLDPVFNRNRVRSCQFDILTDLLLLENQIPIVLLLGLLEMEEKLTEETARIELLRMICDGIIALVHPFSYSLQPKTGESAAEHKDREAKLREALHQKYKNLHEYNHILGFLHDFIVHESETTQKGEKIQDVRIPIPEDRHHHRHRHLHLRHKTAHKPKKESHYHYLMASATELNSSGMKFKSYDGVPSATSLRFDKKQKTLFLPVIWISDSTEMIFRNLMAVDVCQEKELSVISEYVFLMNSLIKSDKDVALLRKKGIIQTSIGTDKEASELFNGLCKGVNFTFADKDKFMGLKIDVNEWYTRQIMVRFSEFMEKNPKFMKVFTMFWGVVLVLAAAAPSIGSIIKQLYD
ncbi:hypothetical protein SUGI_1092740 [Cryptomeria japonica]|uniref:UPF0481 protein At3g47200 n=1 Tax=Cryptomeria japonica TaxID=3369 RepID=UPI0024149C0B|nr:UPF0481 protein At3g47200 [Cryptomeria japonica]XP_057827871.2 UPF0481 protein At3g47200 [Cryptomeria japonica]GLJ51409.1 hypothetical protein SUGI_1092740 [Cryptomeria japonica]